MCRSIKTLRQEAGIASDEDIEAAALQFVRKLSGYRQPSRANAEAFEQAVHSIAGVSKNMLASLAPPPARRTPRTTAPRRENPRPRGSRTRTRSTANNARTTPPFPLEKGRS
jgi:hypothetical protein